MSSHNAWVEPIQLMDRPPEKVPVYHATVRRNGEVRRWSEMVYDYVVAQEGLDRGRAEGSAVVASGATTRGYAAAEALARSQLQKA